MRTVENVIVMVFNRIELDFDAETVFFGVSAPHNVENIRIDFCQIEQEVICEVFP